MEIPTNRQFPPRRHVLITSALIVVAVLISGCSSGSAKTASPADSHVGVVLEDFKLTTSSVKLKAGRIAFDVVNNGPSTHTFKVDRTDLAADSLPIDDSGLLVLEDAPELHRVGSVASLSIGAKHTLTLDLPPGHYVVYCNLEGHYLSNMRVGIDVS